MIKYFFILASSSNDLGYYSTTNFSENFTTQEILTLDQNIEKLNIKYKIKTSILHYTNDRIIDILFLLYYEKTTDF